MNLEIMSLLTSNTPGRITIHIECSAMPTPRQPMPNSRPTMSTEDSTCLDILPVSWATSQSPTFSIQSRWACMTTSRSGFSTPWRCTNTSTSTIQSGYLCLRTTTSPRSKEYEEVSQWNGNVIKQLNQYLLGVETQCLQGGNPVQRHMFNRAIECTRTLLEF